MLGHGRSYNIRLFWSIELYLLGFKKVLYFVSQSPAVIGIVARTLRMVAHRALGLYLGEDVFGFLGASLKVSKLDFSN